MSWGAGNISLRPYCLCCRWYCGFWWCWNAEDNHQAWYSFAAAKARYQRRRVNLRRWRGARIHGLNHGYRNDIVLHWLQFTAAHKRDNQSSARPGKSREFKLVSISLALTCYCSMFSVGSGELRYVVVSPWSECRLVFESYIVAC